jgi:hypothetical protein
VNDGTEDVPRSSSTNVDAAIHNRALRFAGTFDFANPRIVTSSAARDEFVTRYGTPGTTEYREIEIHMDWSPGHCDAGPWLALVCWQPLEFCFTRLA